MYSSVLEAAKSQIGAHNDSTGSNKYNEWFYGRKSAAPWCAVFMAWCFDQAGIYNRLSGLSGKAGCEYWRKWAINLKLYGKVPKANAIVLFDWNPAAGDGADHIGIVESVGDGYIMTIEGNTSVSGSQINGGYVLRKKRDFSRVMGYIYIDTFADEHIYNVYGEGVPASEYGARVYSAPKFGTAIEELIKPGETAYCFGSHYADGYEWWKVDPIDSKWTRKTSLKNRKTYKKKGVYSYGIGYVASKTGVRVHSAPGMGFSTDEVIPFETKLHCFSSHDKDGFEWWCIDVNRMKWVRKTSLKNRRGIKEFIEL